MNTVTSTFIGNFWKKLGYFLFKHPGHTDLALTREKKSSFANETWSKFLLMTCVLAYPSIYLHKKIAGNLNESSEDYCSM